MKRFFYKATCFAFAFSALLAFSCSSGGDSDGDGNSGSEAIQNEDGTTTLKIQENGDGFVSTTFTKSTDFPGYTGSGYLDGGTSANGSIVYTVLAENDIADAKIAIHYLATEVTRRRAALVSVNGSVINSDNPLSMTTNAKVKKDNCSSSNWKDTEYLTNVSLQKGSNSIIITGCPSWTYTDSDGKTSEITDENCYLNYVDYLVVNGKGIDYGTDTTKYVSLSAISENETAGSVASDASGSNVAENSEITFTATPKEGWTFECWSDGSKENPHRVAVTKNTVMFAHFIPANYTAPSDLVGYATITTDSGDGYTICGGAGASSENTITISSYAELVAKKDILSSDEPKIITVRGTISTKDNSNPLLSEKYTIGSNSTVYGDTTNQGRLQNIEFIVEGENVITVRAQDETRSGKQAAGKQSGRYGSYGCFYTRTTGIWQTVWLESTPADYIKSVRLLPNLAECALGVEATVVASHPATLTATAFYHGKEVGTASVEVSSAAAAFQLPLSELHLWEPGRGELYDLTLTFGEDTVQSYFGMRKVETREGYLYVNDRPVFQRLVLDQGFYPDGIYTAPDDSELLGDIQRSILMGFNGARLHQKIFEPRFLYHCDRLGYLVWEEHGNWGADISNGEAWKFFTEWSEAVERDFNHPAIIGWCPFNEAGTTWPASATSWTGTTTTRTPRPSGRDTSTLPTAQRSPTANTSRSTSDPPSSASTAASVGTPTTPPRTVGATATRPQRRKSSRRASRA